jgi:uncharacterized membrane protein YkoI
MRLVYSFVAAALACTAAAPAQAPSPAPKKAAPAPRKLTLKDLPASVQKTVEDTLQGAEIRNIDRETEDGVAQYEIETMLNGKHRDFNVSTKGALLVVEEETTMDVVPPAAKAAIMKKIADGKLRSIELFKRGGETMYEAGYADKNAKRHEVLVKADGTETKD